MFGVGDRWVETRRLVLGHQGLLAFQGSFLEYFFKWFVEGFFFGMQGL